MVLFSCDVFVACSRSRDDGGDAASSAPPAGEVQGVGGELAAGGRLIPAHAGLERATELPRDPRGPGRDTISGDEHVQAMVRRGYEMMRDTRAGAGAYVGNDLSCANCHLNAGQKEAAWPLVGVATLFPQYRGRAGRLITLEDRIRSCFERSLNGTAPPSGSPELLAMSAYIVWLSRGLPAGESPVWRGTNVIAAGAKLPIDSLDPSLGKTLYERTCAACHGMDGQGIALGAVRPGPLWGDGSWNDGAGAARVYTLAGFIRYAMPLTAPGTLTDAEAQNIAAYINSQERPHYRHQAEDYADGAIPVDAVYYTKRYPVNPLRRSIRPQDESSREALRDP
jgi:thiosulfate dehydrogenase